MSIKAKLEALIYAAEDPISLDQMAALLKDDLLALRNQPASEPDPAISTDMAAEAPRLLESSPLESNSGESSSLEAATTEQAGTQDERRNETRSGAPAEGEALQQEPTDAQAESHQNGAALRNTSSLSQPDARDAKTLKSELRALLQPVLRELIAEFQKDDHGIEIREVAKGYRMSTKPEHHDVVRGFAKSLKPPIKLSLQALETLAVIAYKQPVTVPEISEIRGADSAGVIGTLLERKLITTAGRKAVVGRPMLYKTTKDFLVRFGLKDISELPSIEEFEKIAADREQGDLFVARDAAIADATGVPHDTDAEPSPEDHASDLAPPESESSAHDASRNAAAAQVPAHIPVNDSRTNDSITGDAGAEQMAEDKAAVPENVTEPSVSSDPQHTVVDEEAAGQVASESTGG